MQLARSQPVAVAQAVTQNNTGSAMGAWRRDSAAVRPAADVIAITVASANLLTTLRMSPSLAVLRVGGIHVACLTANASAVKTRMSAGDAEDQEL